jgi:hypothetical protein
MPEQRGGERQMKQNLNLDQQLKTGIEFKASLMTASGEIQ